MQEGYTARAAAKICGIPFPTIDAWDRGGFLRASVPSSGRGRYGGRSYSFADLVRLRVARELRERGVSLQALRRVVKALRAQELDLGNVRFAVVRGRAFVVEDDGALLDLIRKQAAFGFVLDLAAMRADLEARAKRAAKVA